ncbi:MAG: hypothetical protein ACYDBQ_06935 [Thermoplasmatota archaeon]
MKPSATALRLALAHHPLCAWFADDVVTLAGLRVCSGCLAAWPAFALSIPLAWHFVALKAVTPLMGVAVGAVLGVPQLASYVWRGSRSQRAVTKAAGGAGLALLAVGAAALRLPLAVDGVLLAALAAAFVALQALRARSLLRTCGRCPWARDWERCPGFIGHVTRPAS